MGGARTLAPDGRRAHGSLGSPYRDGLARLPTGSSSSGAHDRDHSTSPAGSPAITSGGTARLGATDPSQGRLTAAPGRWRGSSGGVAHHETRRLSVAPFPYEILCSF